MGLYGFYEVGRMNYSYSDLRLILKKERESSALTPLDDNFYDDVKKLLNDKREEAFRGDSLVAMKEYENIKRIILAIKAKREEKIALMAVRGDFEEDKLTREEKELLRKLAIVFEEYSKGFMNKSDNKEETKGTDSDSREKTADEEERKMLVRILSPVERYKGADGKVYGPFEKNEEVFLPPVEAEFLISSKLAELVGSNVENVEVDHSSSA